jgi:hypothetical protein
MRPLLWKEWHEQNWKLAFGCIVLSAIAVIGLHARMVADATLIEWVCVLGATMLPILSSTGLVPAERAEGSFESLLAMPIAPWRILLAKTLMGLLLCAGPLAVAAIITVFMAGGREIENRVIFTLYLRTIFASLSLLVWMMAVTIRLPSEARAAMVAVGIWILWGMITGGLLGGPGIGSYFFPMSPLAFFLEFAPQPHPSTSLLKILLMQTALLAVVWMIALRVVVRPADRQ